MAHRHIQESGLKQTNGESGPPYPHTEELEHLRKQLIESEERYHVIYTCSPIGIALFDTDGILLDNNESFIRMLAWLSPQKNVDSLFTLSGMNPTVHEQLAAPMPVTIETETHGDDDGHHAVKRFKWHISMIPSPGTTKRLFMAQVQNITERKQTNKINCLKAPDTTTRADVFFEGVWRNVHEQVSFGNMISRSPEMKQIFDLIPQVALSTATVLVTGDSGTGKELIARSIHELSDRKKQPFIAINCSALPDSLLESELFGYKAGAFTDARKDKPGRFARGEGGTVFLDEIGDISPALQVKLLRVLQERIYEPLGATTPVNADIRIIAATNKNLLKMVECGSFREDLFYRINIVTIQLPSLRERRCDIPPLCNYFIERFNSRYHKNIKGLTDEALQLLMSHDFPGNIRELENIIEHAFIFCKHSPIDTVHLPSPFKKRDRHSTNTILRGIKDLEELERLYIKSILFECNNDKTVTARRLGIHKATLFRKLKQMRL